MRLSDVRAGMQCKGLSVIRGTAISAVRRRGDRRDPAATPPRPGRASSSASPARPSTPTGVGPRLLRLADLSARAATVCGATPARSPRASASSATRSPSPRPSSRSSAQSPEAAASARSAPALRRSARPIATPLTVSGLSSPRPPPPGARRQARRRPGAGGAVGPARGLPRPGPPRPGPSVSAGIAGGDLAIGSIGTVAYRDGSAIWAFGHPIDAAGRRALALQDAYVFAVINNPLRHRGGDHHQARGARPHARRLHLSTA